MRHILKIEEHIPVSPDTKEDPFYRMTYIVKEEIRKYKWIEGEKGRNLSWDEARRQWISLNGERFESFHNDILKSVLEAAL